MLNAPSTSAADTSEDIVAVIAPDVIETSNIIEIENPVSEPPTKKSKLDIGSTLPEPQNPHLSPHQIMTRIADEATITTRNTQDKTATGIPIVQDQNQGYSSTRVRNNLHTFRMEIISFFFYLHSEISGKKQIAKWEHIQQFYYLDKSENVRICPKLPDRHILPSKINKMKVSLCMQVFSHQVVALMLRISKWAVNDRLGLDTSAEDTAQLILFLDQLFDSLNGNVKVGPISKPVKGGVTLTSGHEEFWREAINIIQTMKFYCPKKKNTFVSNPSITNLKFTLPGFIKLKQSLIENGPFLYFLPRALNQDPLENFFGAIRGHGMSSHSPGANCDEDFSEGALDNLRYFLTGEEMEGVTVIPQDDDIQTTSVDPVRVYL
ncbi:hypothetical protein NQ315_014854, partial [Exocentrus adspersus]